MAKTGNWKEEGVFAPLGESTFRSMWFGYTLANTGVLIQAVGSAWMMSSISTADDVALVQTASFLPMALLALPAGAVADIYDRRKVQIVFLAFSAVAAALMTLCTVFRLITPWILLAFCFLISAGSALFSPARVASVAEMVPKQLIPQAAALNSISYNLARSIGPALGGVLVATIGAAATFGVNALAYLPMLESLRRWQRVPEISRLPREGLARSINAGVLFTIHMQPVRRAIGRALVFCFIGAVVQSLLPLVARNLLQGDAKVFGLLLGGFGVGAVAGIFVLERLRTRIGNEGSLRLTSVVLALSCLVLSLSHSVILDWIFLLLAGMAWMVTTTAITITVQLFVPRWVMGRAMATCMASFALGIAMGAWLWGNVATHYGVAFAYESAAFAFVVSLVFGKLYPLADRTASTESDEVTLKDPEVHLGLGISGRSGPICIELQYEVPDHQARSFYNLMREMQALRRRTGAYDWSISRNIADPTLWLERYRCPTWHDYLRQRQRHTSEDRILLDHAQALHVGLEPIKVIRWLDRPSGSVRWQEESPDRGDGALRLDS